MSVLPNQTNINATEAFFLRANAQLINASSINAGNISTNTLEANSAAFSTTFAYEMFIDNQGLTATPTELLLNGVPIATTANLSSIQDWAIYPAVSTLNMEGNNIISTNNLSAQNIVTQNLVAYNTLAVSSFTSTISSLNLNADAITISSINGQPFDTGGNLTLSSLTCGSTISTPSFFVSSINGQPISYYEPGAVSTVSTFDTLATSSLSVSSINGSEFTTSSITVNVVGVSSLVATSISSIGAELRQALVSTIQFNPSLGGVSLGGVNLGLGSILGNVVGWGAGVFGAAAGTVGMITGTAALMNGRPGNNINTNNFELINGTTQLQFSTLGSSITSVQRFVSSTGDPSEVPGEEYFISTILPAGTHAVRSFSDPLNTMSSPTSSIQAFGQWVEVPFSMPSSISSINNWAEFPAVSTIDAAGFNLLNVQNATVSSINIPGSYSTLQGTLEIGYVDGLNGGQIKFNQVSSASTYQILTQHHPPAGGGSLLLTLTDENLNYSDAALRGLYFGSGPVSSAPNGHIVAGSAGLEMTLVSSINGSAYPPLSGPSISTLELTASTISTANILGAATDMFGIPGYNGGLNLVASTLSLTSTPLVVHTGNYNGSTCAFFQGRIRDVVASTITTSSMNVTGYASISSISSGQAYFSSINANKVSFGEITSFGNASGAGLYANVLSTLNLYTSSISMWGAGPYNLSSIMSLSTPVVAGSGSSTVTTLNTDLNLGSNLLWARQARLGLNNTNENISEVLMYGGGGDFRVFKSGQGDTTVRVGTNASGTNTGYLLDTLLNKPVFSTINGSTSMLCYIPSSLTSTIGVSTLAVIPPLTYIASVYDSTTQLVVGANTSTPTKWNSASLNIGGFTIGTSTIGVPIAGTYEFNASLQFATSSGGTNKAQFWLTKNGSALAQTNSIVSVVNNGDTLGNITLLDTAAAADKYGVMFYSPDANMAATATAAGATPAIPSIILNAKRVG